MTHTVLIVEDDPVQRKVIERIITGKLGYEAQLARSGQEALTFMNHKKGKTVDLMLLDLSMPEMNGMDVLRELKPLHPDLPVIVRTAHDDTNLVVEAMHHGAVDFVKKEESFERLQHAVQNALRIHALNYELLRLKRQLHGKASFADIIGESEQLIQAKDLAKRASNSDVTLLIQGEAGTGRKLFARVIHAASKRKEQPLIEVNCSSIPSHIIESVLFGCAKKTGRIPKSQGKISEADGGALLIDNIDALPLALQSKLFDVIQHHAVTPIGDTQPHPVNIRIIASSKANLEQYVEEERFLKELYDALHIFPITIPPLRECQEDISALVWHFYSLLASQEGKNITDITDDAMEVLEGYEWPGNIRQLYNTLFRAVILCDDNVLTLDHLVELSDKQVQKNSSTPTCSQHSVSILDKDGQIRTLEDIEKEAIYRIYVRCNTNIAKTARILGISRSTLYRKLEEFGLEAAKT